MITFDKSLSFDDVTLIPRFSNLESRSEADPSMCGYDLPLIASPMNTVTSPEMMKLFVDSNLLATVHRYFRSAKEQLDYVLQLGNVPKSIMEREYNKKARHPDLIRRYADHIYFAVGTVHTKKEWIDFLFRNGIHNFCIDMAMGNSKHCVDTVEYIRSLKYDLPSPENGDVIGDGTPKIIAANVVTKNGMERLIKAGADAIRVGIGNGSICSTRTNTGFGVPQFSALIACAERKRDVMLIADGGIRSGGDIAKAIKAGADMVMMGKLLAGTKYAMGQCYDKDKNPIDPKIDGWDKVVYRAYRGMASNEARSGVLSDSSIEGVSGLVKYTGTTEELINNIKLNLQASLSYAGVRDWNEFRTVVKVLEITTNSSIESQTHVL